MTNPNPDMMNQLTLMLQQGMSTAEVAKTLNIKLDEQTHELLTTLKQQLDLAAALAKQSALSQGATVPDSSARVGKTYDYSNSTYTTATDNSAGVGDVSRQAGDNTGVQLALNQMLSKQGDLRSQDPSYNQAGDSAGFFNSRDPYSQYERPVDASINEASNSSFTENSLPVDDYPQFGADSQPRAGIPDTYGDNNRDTSISSGLNSDMNSTGYNRYNNSDGRSSSVQKQYSYGSDYSDGEGAQKISSHRNSSSSSYSGGHPSSAGMLGSPPFRNAGDSASGANASFGHQLSDDGRGPASYGSKSQTFKGQQFVRAPSGARPLMTFDSSRGRSSRGGYREKW